MNVLRRKFDLRVAPGTCGAPGMPSPPSNMPGRTGPVGNSAGPTAGESGDVLRAASSSSTL
jgi:hypothetical protein